MSYFKNFPMLVNAGASGSSSFVFTVDTTKAGSASDTFILKWKCWGL